MRSPFRDTALALQETAALLEEKVAEKQVAIVSLEAEIADAHRQVSALREETSPSPALLARIAGAVLGACLGILAGTGMAERLLAVLGLLH